MPKKSLSTVCAEFEPLEGKHSKTEQIAHCLFFFAERKPLVFIPPELIYRAVFQLQEAPDRNSQEIRRFCALMGNVAALLKKRGRALISSRGVGFRANVGTQDIQKLTCISRASVG
jgi:hypothetical protein